MLKDRSIALVHEWFGATGGSEKVFMRMCGIFPQAERFVLWQDDDAADGELNLRPSWLGRTPLRKVKAAALPAMPLAWRTLSRETFDVVISSSHAFAHTVKMGSPETTRYLSYVHTPARYVWSPDFDGRGSSPLLAGPRSLLKAVDLRLSSHVHSYAANSREVRERIRKFWGRDCVVINPPVDVDHYGAAPIEDRVQPRDYLLGIGRWIKYKNFDLMIAIADAVRLPLVIAGSGPEEEELRRLAAKAGVPVTFEVRPDDDRMRRLYWGAKALLYPAHEDFGIIPVEAQACGTPVVGLARGGLLETVADGETGFLVDSLEPAQYAAVLRHLGELDRGKIQRHAAEFSQAAFDARFAAWVEQETA